jgi:sterol desaturase/sphingolipid hydroxylase (fatty acid hydroxylase superfamily)
MRRARWRWVNLSAGALNALLVRVVLPGGLIYWAALGQQLWGEAPPAWLGLLLLDFAVYAQHWLFHHVAWLWPVHAPHHADPELDLTTGLRFHPLEALLSAAWKGLVILAAGIGAPVVAAYEVVLAASSLFSHANLRWQGPLARGLDRIWMTPALHRVHHSLEPVAQRRNLSAGFALWDWLFRTWQATQPVPAVGLQVVAGSDLGPVAAFWKLPFIFRKLRV